MQKNGANDSDQAMPLVLRHRNHPCIILYSAGNEIHDTPKPDIAKPILRQIVDIYHEADPTRPVTQALFRPNVSHDYENGLSDMLDVVGTNYRDSELLAARRDKPDRKIVGTEARRNARKRMTRTDYSDDEIHRMLRRVLAQQQSAPTPDFYAKAAVGLGRRRQA